MPNISWPLTTQSSDDDGEDCSYLGGFGWRKTYLTDVTLANLVALTVINLLAVIPTILLNALVIVAVATRHRLQSASNVLVAWLAGADLLYGLVLQNLEIALDLTRILSYGPYCGLKKASFVAMGGLGVLSFGNLVLISIDRYISIKHPLRYMTIVTKKRLKTGLLLVWATALFVSIHELSATVVSDSVSDLYRLYIKVANSILSMFVLVAIAVISYTYCYIFSESRRQKKRLQTEQLSEEEAKRSKKKSKAANTLTLILVTLVVSYIPSIVLVLIAAYSEDILVPHTIGVIWSWTVTFSLLGSLCNPIIFFWRIKNMRRAILEILHYRQPENSPPPIEMIDIKRYRPEIQASTTEAFSRTTARRKPILLSFKNTQVDEIIHVEEAAV